MIFGALIQNLKPGMRYHIQEISNLDQDQKAALMERAVSIYTVAMQEETEIISNPFINLN